MHWVARSVALGLVLVLAVATAVGYTYLNSALEPTAPERDEAVMVQVKSGMNSRQLAHELHDQGLIANAWGFHLLSRWRGVDGQMQAGWYNLRYSMSAEEILKRIVSGETANKRFTIPEGLTAEQVVDTLVHQEMGKSHVFEELLSARERIEEFLPEDYGPGPVCDKFDRPKTPLEGYLLPGTYEVSWGATEEEVLSRLVDATIAIWTEDRLQRAEKLDLSIHEVLTLASIVEREAQADEERPVIASVFLNRLDIGMKLDACATVAYILGEAGRNITTEETLLDTPYNTYKYGGLPPGPIANPGIESIDAVLNPASTRYLYFVSRGDGTHAFSENYQQHLQKVDKYQR